MAAVADLERFLERMFERTSARLFRSRVQAVQVERRVERAMEAGRTRRGSSTTVPSRFRVRLHPADLDDLAARTGGPDALAGRLAERAFAFARLHGYHMAARPSVSVVADPSLERGRVDVDATPGAPRPEARSEDVIVASVPARPPSVPTVPAEPMAPPPPAPTPAEAPVIVEVAAVPAPPEADPAPEEAPAPVSGLRGAGDRRGALRPATPPPPRARLRVVEFGGREREVRVEDAPLTLGRAPDNGLVIKDARVSRHHGRFANRHGTLLYTDLGSTNGTRVNGIRVDEIVLGAGDRLQVGDVVVVVEQLPG